MGIPELCAWGLCLWVKSTFFFSCLFGPPLLISRLITSSQVLQVGVEKRKFVIFRHISQICVTLLVWKKFRCKQRCWAYKHWSVSIDEAYNVAGTWESFAAKANKWSPNESFPCVPAHLRHSHVALFEEACHNINPRGLGLLGGWEVLGTSTSDADMRPAVPVPVVVQDEGCLALLTGATGRVSAAWPAALPAAALPPCSATVQHAHPAFLQIAWGDHGRAGPLGTWGGAISITLLCSSWPPSLAIPPSPSGHWFWLGLLNPCSRDKLSTTKYKQG